MPPRGVLREFVGRYCPVRPHGALHLRPPLAGERPAHVIGAVLGRDRLGGLIREYTRRAA
ncbi:MAG: hypothetical protein M3O34_02855 [Chloroflexota bacterium]|nr:hypothetical protein [Chloroflexota bacterium]